MDNNTVLLNEIVSKLEDVYGITECMKESNDAKTVITAMNKKIATLPKSEVAKCNQLVGDQFILLAYLCFRMDFYKTSILDFKPFSSVDKLFDTLDLFADKDSFTKENLAQMNWIVNNLAKADTESTNTRMGLAYRYLRAFIIVVLYNNTCNASVIANVLIQQINLQNSLQNGGK